MNRTCDEASDDRLHGGEALTPRSGFDDDALRALVEIIVDAVIRGEGDREWLVSIALQVHVSTTSSMVWFIRRLHHDSRPYEKMLRKKERTHS